MQSHFDKSQSPEKHVFKKMCLDNFLEKRGKRDITRVSFSTRDLIAWESCGVAFSTKI